MLRPDQLRRYARHLLLPEVGGTGQARLLAATVRVDDATGAGAAALVYLAAAGIGTLVITDPGMVRAGDGALYELGDEGRPRLGVVRERVLALNPDVQVVAQAGAGVWPLVVEPGDAGPVEWLARGSAAAARLVRAIASGAAPPEGPPS